MTLRPHRPTSRRAGARRTASPRPRGVALLYALIALTVMLIAAAAMVRSFNTSMFTAGNLGFKRDLTNQAERAVQATTDALVAGALADEAVRRANLPASNYSATRLATNAQGLPQALLDDDQFGAVGVAANDIAVEDQQVRIRYVIDRLCADAGAPSVDHCTMVAGTVPDGGSGANLIRADADVAAQQVVYRLSVRVDGPRNTQAFLQSTFAY